MSDEKLAKLYDIADMSVQCLEDSQAWFPEAADSLPFVTLALCGEAGELANIVKKVARGSLELNADVRFDMVMEATDVLIYLLNIFAMLKYDPALAYEIKREQNEARFGRDSSGTDGGLREAEAQSVEQGS